MLDRGELFFNKVGTFGVSSASYWWSRAGGAWARLVQYIVTHRSHFSLLLFADDSEASAAGPDFSPSLLVPLLLADVLGLPVSWSKIRGGTSFDWVGYHVLLDEFRLGIS